MTMENAGDRKTSPVTENIQPPAHASVRNPSRRRFNRAGVGASAVVLTLASRSVLADTVCKSPSGFDSLAPSMAANATQNSCTGKPVSQWLLQDPWPIAKDVPFASIFGNGYPGLYAGAASATGAVGGAASLNTGKNWLEPFSNNPNASASGSSNSAGNGNGNGGNANGVIKSNGNDNNELLLKDATLFQAMAGSRTPVVVKNLIAALLNFKQGYNSFPTDTDVVRIFQEWQQKGYYEVRATVKWYDPEINRYLASTNSVG